MVQLLLDSISLKLTLVTGPQHLIGPLLSNPLQPIVRQKLLHLRTLLLVLIALLSNPLNIAHLTRITRHPQPLILLPQRIDLQCFLLILQPQRLIKLLQLCQPLRHRRHQVAVLGGRPETADLLGRRQPAPVAEFLHGRRCPLDQVGFRGLLPNDVAAARLRA